MKGLLTKIGCALLFISAACLIESGISSSGASADVVASGAAGEKGWEFVRPVAQEPPAVRNASWVRNPIDSFVLAKLEEQGLSPSAAASRESLIRRVYLDLIGLPPSPAEVDAFVADLSPNAYGKVVDRLLASPHYGERWARHWLDLARYADSEGFKADETRPYMWRYRDYVIDAFNSDKPYDRFLREQIAGDELWPSDPQARIATGFLRSYADESNARELFQRRQEILNDDTDTVGAVFLGLTFGCARCHDHKYDPISQRDYYRLQAFFAAIRADDHIIVASPGEIADHDAKLAAWEQKTRDIRREMASLEAKPRKAILKDYFDKYPPEIQASLLKPAANRTPIDWVLHYKAAQYMEPDSYQYLAPPAACLAGMSAKDKTRYHELQEELSEFDDLKPASLPLGTGIVDACAEAPNTYVLRLGVFNAPKAQVDPGFPSAVASDAAHIEPLSSPPSTGRRTALANWLASADNPLVARVMVNRIWHYHFGQGIVATPSDFGVQGDPPTHPELLDWLVTEFVRDGWSIKKLHRLIVTSSTYRQSTAPRPAEAKADPDDNLLWRFPRKRLEAEIIRDSALAVAGVLNPKMGGPGVFPEIPAGMEVRGGWTVAKNAAERNRRSVYIFVRRNTRYPMLEAFDMPDPYETCPRRYRTTTPSQALMLLNNGLTIQWAQRLAGRVLNQGASNRNEMIVAAYRLAYCRHPSPEEMQDVGEFLDRQESIIADRIAKGEVVSFPEPPGKKLRDQQAAALVDLCHVLMNSNEFVYSD